MAKSRIQFRTATSEHRTQEAEATSAWSLRVGPPACQVWSIADFPLRLQVPTKTTFIRPSVHYAMVPSMVPRCSELPPAAHAILQCCNCTVGVPSTPHVCECVAFAMSHRPELTSHAPVCPSILTNALAVLTICYVPLQTTDAAKGQRRRRLHAGGAVGVVWREHPPGMAGRGQTWRR
jgi:hypothetical protein